MNLQLESFLETALGSIEPTSNQIGRVVVEPDYEASLDEHEASTIAEQLTACLRDQKPEPDQLSSPQGDEIQIGNSYPVLRKYVLRITLHADGVEGSWVEVAPPGNWI